MNIKFNYKYRDGSNYKNFNSVIFANVRELDLKEVEERISKILIDRQWFFAEKWKLPDLHFGELPWDSESDVDWHEFESVESTLEEVTERIDISNFLKLIESKDRDL